MGYIPPTAEGTAATVRVRPPTPQAPDTWRLEARRPPGTVIRVGIVIRHNSDTLLAGRRHVPTQLVA